jgi:hypothetical protein
MTLPSLKGNGSNIQEKINVENSEKVVTWWREG